MVDRGSHSAPPAPEPAPAAPPGSRAARTKGFTAFHLRGVPIRVDWSWFIIAGLIAWTYGQRMSTGVAALVDAPPAVIVTAALGATALFFLSILAHELGHAFTSLDRGIPVVGITMFMLGGVTESTREAETARDEFVIVGVGPFISLVLAALLGLVYTTVTGLPAVAAVVGYLAWTNLALAVFNVLPGYPMDGGRLLRSLLWLATGRPHQATRWAARVGQVFALLLMTAAVWSVIDGPLIGPVWLRVAMAVLISVGPWGALIGFFLLRGASQAHSSATLREQLSGLTVAQVMGSAPRALPEGATLAEVADEIARKPSLLWPVGDPVTHVVRLADLDRVPGDRWAVTPLRAVSRPTEGHTVAPGTDLDHAVRRLAGAPGHQLLVVEEGRPVGLLTESLVVADLPGRP